MDGVGRPDDRLTYTFAPRDDVTFCSGKKFAAADVIYSCPRLADPSATWPFHWRLGNIDSLTAPRSPHPGLQAEAPARRAAGFDLANFVATIINRTNVETLGADFGVKGFDGARPLCWQK